jgi:hypothetical protein
LLILSEPPHPLFFLSVFQGGKRMRLTQVEPCCQKITVPMLEHSFASAALVASERWIGRKLQLVKHVVRPNVLHPCLIRRTDHRLCQGCCRVGTVTPQPLLARHITERKRIEAQLPFSVARQNTELIAEIREHGIRYARAPVSSRRYCACIGAQAGAPPPIRLELVPR